MFELTIWTYLLLCTYVGIAWWAAARRRPGDPYRRAVLGVVGLMATGAAWMLWALIFPRHHPHASGDITYESVGCLLACLAGLYAVVVSMRARSLAGAMSVVGSGWLLMLYLGLVART